MMKKNKLAVACMAAIVGMTLAGCNNDDSETVIPPVEPPPPVETEDLAFSAKTDSSPVDQGWTAKLGGEAYGKLVEDTLADGSTVLAWYVDGRAGIAEWNVTPEGDFNAMASQNGWTMAFTVRVESGNYITNYYGNGTKRFLPVLKLDGDNLLIELEGDKTYTLVEGDSEAAKGYHSYVISYDPAAGKATVQVDDQVITSDWQGSESSHNVVSWGNGSSSSTYASEAYYQSFTFDIPDYEFTPSFKLFKAAGEPGDEGSKAYRIPAIQSAMGDYVFAFAEGRPSGADPGQAGEIALSAKFSADGGETWSLVENISKSLDPESKYDFSDARPIYNEKTGELMVLYTQWPTDCAQNGDCVKPDDANKLIAQTFDFNKKVWNDPVDVTDQTRERAWDARGWGGPAAWKYDIADDVQGIDSEIWSYVTERKVTQGKITDYLRTDDKMFLPSVTLTADNDLVVEFNGDNSGPHTLVEDIGPANFYTSEIRYNPVSKTASYIFDGKTIIEDWTGAALVKGKQLVFGNDESTVDGRASYKSVTFKIGNEIVHSYDASVPVTADANPAAQGWTAYLESATSERAGAGILGWKSVNAGPGNGIQLQWQTPEQGDHDGRMILPAIILDGYGYIGVKSVYSDDNGETWKTGAYAPTSYAWSGNTLQQAQPSESDLVELTDGRLLLTTRNDGHQNYDANKYGPRIQFISDNGGETWVYDADSTLPNNIDEVDASLIRYSGEPGDDDTMLLFSAPIGNVPGDKKRANLGIWHSTDEGETWNGPRQVWTGDSWYSDMTMMPDGKVGILVETGGYHITLMQKEIDELMPEAKAQQ